MHNISLNSCRSYLWHSMHCINDKYAIGFSYFLQRVGILSGLCDIFSCWSVFSILLHYPIESRLFATYLTRFFTVLHNFILQNLLKEGFTFIYWKCFWRNISLSINWVIQTFMFQTKGVFYSNVLFNLENLFVWNFIANQNTKFI